MKYAGTRLPETIAHTFADYASGARTIRVQLAGKDSEGWAGAYGTFVDGLSITIAALPPMPQMPPSPPPPPPSSPSPLSPPQIALLSDPLAEEIDSPQSC